MIYLLAGANHYGIQAKLRSLTDSFARQYGKEGIERYDGESVSPNELPSLLQGISLFTPKRLVVVRDASRNKALWEELGEWPDRIPEEVTLVLVESSPDKRTRTYKTFVKKAEMFEASELNEGTAVSWLQNEAKVRGSSIGRKEAQLLVSRVGTSQSQLSRELDKLIVHPSITAELIASVTEATPQATVFELLDVVLNHQPQKAQVIIAELKGAEDPYKLFGLLSSQVYALAVMVAAGSKIATQEIAKDTGLHPFVLGKLTKSARSVRWEEVRRIISILADLDDKLKGSGSDSWALLEIALMKIASR